MLWLMERTFRVLNSYLAIGLLIIEWNLLFLSLNSIDAVVY